MEGMGRLGGIVRYSLSALTIQTPYVTASIPPKAIAVFDRQLDGRVHQPPAGDQTNLGYGYLAPPPMGVVVNDESLCNTKLPGWSQTSQSFAIATRSVLVSVTMRLAALVPSLSAELVSSLGKCGVRTDADLLFRPVVEIYRQLSPESGISLLDIERAAELTAKLASAPGISGDELLAQEIRAQEQAPVLLSGVSSLDNLLGGFGGRRVIEITGDRQSGKTTLALNVILRHLSGSSQSRVVWVDTTGDFSAENSAQILNTFNSEAASTALDRLQVSMAFDIEAAYNILEELKSPSATWSNTRLSCVVFDAITPLLGPLLSAASAQGHSIMTEFMYHLRHFSQLHSCPVLVINNTSLSTYNSKVPSESRKPALGPSFKFLTDATVWLSKCDERAESDCDHNYALRSAEVLRSRTTASKTCSMFKISQGKIFDL